MKWYLILWLATVEAPLGTPYHLEGRMFDSGNAETECRIYQMMTKNRVVEKAQTTLSFENRIEDYDCMNELWWEQQNTDDRHIPRLYFSQQKDS